MHPWQMLSLQSLSFFFKCRIHVRFSWFQREGFFCHKRGHKLHFFSFTYLISYPDPAGASPFLICRSERHSNHEMFEREISNTRSSLIQISLTGIVGRIVPSSPTNLLQMNFHLFMTKRRISNCLISTVRLVHRFKDYGNQELKVEEGQTRMSLVGTRRV